MKAVLLSIGTELTRGELVNSNAAWLSEQLTALGCVVIEQAAVPDDRELIVSALRRLSKSAPLLLATGGLGPTTDDLTAEAAANAAGKPLQRDEVTLARIRTAWERRGREMPPSNCRQAQLPEGAVVVQNDVGTAPAFSVMLDACECWFFPGVPTEMEHLFNVALAPKLRASVVRSTHQLHLRCFGQPESYVGELLQDVEDRFPMVTLAYRPHFPELEVKILAKGASEAMAEKLAQEAAAVITERLGAVIYSSQGDSLAAVVGRELRAAGKTLAIAESCTGGMLGKMITDVPGSSDYLLLDVVCYSNAAKRDVVGVREEVLRAHGAVSEETAEAMAEGALRLAQADLAVSITGIAGPGGGTDQKPVGTVWVATARHGHPTRAVHHFLPWDRDRIRTMASYLALQAVADALRADGSRSG